MNPNDESGDPLAPSASGRAEAHVLEGNAMYRRGDLEGAARAYEAALALAPGYARAHFNLAVVMQHSGEVEAALQHYRTAANLDPANARALVNWGNLLKDRGEIEGAEALYRHAAQVDPRDPSALNNLASLALLYRGEADVAAAHYRRALEIDRGNLEALRNLAAVEHERGDLSRADSLYERVLEFRPDDVEAAYARALIALARQDFERGWEGHELRFVTNPPSATIGSPRRPFATPEQLLRAPSHVAIRKEQGIGDQILFCTLLPELAAHGISAVVEIDDRLLEIFRRSMPEVQFVGSRDSEILERCALHFPMGSLPRVFRRSVSSFRSQRAALLVPDRVRAREYRASREDDRMNIAISWRSFQLARRRHVETRKSAPLECFAGLGRDVRLVDLQYGDVTSERECFDERHPGLRHQVAGLDVFGDIDGVIAAIESCDRVVTTSNVTAHLAGAIGKPTWLVFPAASPPFHYWTTGPGRRSLWYPSVEIVTDPSWATWQEVFANVAARLAREAPLNRPRPS